MPNPKLAEQSTFISEDEFNKHKGELHNVGTRRFKVIDDEVEYNAPEGGPKSTNLYQGPDKGYFETIAGNQKYYKEDGSPMSAQEINMLTGTIKISPGKFDDYNKHVGYKSKQTIVTFEKGTEDRELTEEITGDVPEVNDGGGSSTGDIPEGGGGSVTYDWTKTKDKIKHPKITGDGLEICSSENPTACGLNMSKQLKSEKKANTKAYNEAQKNRSYRVKKDGTQVLKKQFAPGEWFSEKMDNFKNQRTKNQAKKDQNQRQREIKKESNRRRKLKQIEFQHEHSDRYSKVSNFFNELAYKRKTENKPKKRTITASF